MIAELIARHWEMLDALLAAVGLVVYVAASHTLNQRRHPSAAIGWVMGILLLPYLVLPLYLAFGTRKVVPTVRALPGVRNALANASTHATAERSQQLAQAKRLSAFPSASGAVHERPAWTPRPFAASQRNARRENRAGGG